MEQVSLDLQNDRERVELELEHMPEFSLDQAISKGFVQGRKRESLLRRRRFGIQMLATVVSIFLLLTTFVRVSPAFASMLRDIPGFSGFVELIEGDTTLWRAVNNEFLQPVNLSDSKNGYTLTVDGIIADEGRVVILFSGVGPNVNKNTEIKDYKLKDENGDDLVAAISGFYAPDDEGDQVAIMHDTLDIMMGDGNSVPKIIRFETLLEGQWLAVDIPVDHNKFKGMKEVIPVNSGFVVGGQQFTVTEAVITPLQVKVHLQTDQRNSKRSNSFIKLALVDEMGRRWESTGGQGTTDDAESVIIFQSTYFEKPEKLTLVADGLLLSEKGKKLVINTKTGETIETPDSRISLESDPTSRDITIKLSNLDEVESHYGYWILEHDAKFQDAEGKTYQLQDNGSSWRSSGTTSTGFLYYTLPIGDYKQPLTFDVYQYPGYVLEPVNVIIK